MSNALFVSLSESYPELDSPTLHFETSEALKNVTCGWWKIDLNNAKDVKFVFGVYKGEVVSAYRVINDMKAKKWPRIKKWPTEDGKGFEDRKYVPTNRVTGTEWDNATTWKHIPIAGPILYGTVTLDGGKLTSTQPTFP